jgi:ABC-type Mn2+/Zn2+ transport system ATPase subunit
MMRRDSDGPAVRLRDALFAYGDHVALRVDDLELPRGCIAAAIGPNGSGKSTLLAAITGLVTPSRGTVETLGRRPAMSRRRVAHVLQETAANERLPITVREVVAIGRYAASGPFRPLSRDDRRAIERAMERVAISDLQGRQLRELSGGQRQRVYVAQGLAQEAELLLLDEPATGLDVTTHDRLLDLMREERDEGRTVVFTTHDIGEAAGADLALLLSGTVVAFGPPDDVLTADGLSRAYGGHVHVTADGTVVVDDPHHHRGDHPHMEGGRVSGTQDPPR